MKKLLNREKNEQGMSLSELFVVLGVTVVLAVILMPAISSNGDPDRARDILSVAALPVVVDGQRKTNTTSDEKRRAQYREDASGEMSEAATQTDDSAESQETEQLREGMVELLTTDVLRRHRR